MSKSKKRRAYRCGKCGENGHNARTCPTKAVAAVKAEAEAVDALAETPKPEAPKHTAPEGQFPLDGTSDLTEARRTGPSDRPAVPAAPYECPACHQVAVLVLVELRDTQKALRCEKCRNSTPISKILKWGALPKDKPAEAWQRRSSLI